MLQAICVIFAAVFAVAIVVFFYQKSHIGIHDPPELHSPTPFTPLQPSEPSTPSQKYEKNELKENKLDLHSHETYSTTEYEDELHSESTVHKNTHQWIIDLDETTKDIEPSSDHSAIVGTTSMKNKETTSEWESKEGSGDNNDDDDDDKEGSGDHNIGTGSVFGRHKVF